MQTLLSYQHAEIADGRMDGQTEGIQQTKILHSIPNTCVTALYISNMERIQSVTISS